jgi:transposase
LKLRFEKREASEMPRRKKARYGREMRARAADLFEAGLGFELAAKKLDVPAPAVRKWLYAYRATGRKGLIGMGESRRTYDMETKLAVARAVVDEGMPRSEAMARFGIAAATSLDRWCRLYREGGPEALEPGRRGRPEGPGGRTRERELEERVRKLEAQVAYLKKSIALKAEKSSRTGRKPRS